jgi:hypothetical protein
LLPKFNNLASELSDLDLKILIGSDVTSQSRFFLGRVFRLRNEVSHHFEELITVCGKVGSDELPNTVQDTFATTSIDAGKVIGKHGSIGELLNYFEGVAFKTVRIEFLDIVQLVDGFERLLKASELHAGFK